MSEPNMVLITDDFIESGKSTAGGFSKAQLALLGIPWPPVGGWKAVVVGQKISSDAASRFLAGRGTKMAK